MGKVGAFAPVDSKERKEGKRRREETLRCRKQEAGEGHRGVRWGSKNSTT